MVAIAFDTLKYSKRLKDAGVPDKQAEAEAEALAEVLEVNLKDLATKEDLKTLEQRLGDKINVIEQRLGDKITMLEQRMTIKLGTLMVIAVGIAHIQIRGQCRHHETGLVKFQAGRKRHTGTSDGHTSCKRE